MENESDGQKLLRTVDILKNCKDIPVGSTPNEIISEKRLYRLRHYKSKNKKIFSTPILIVYALMNRSYIFDLQKDKSWIGNLVDQGFDVYLIDWKDPKKIDKFVSFDDYINIFIDECVKVVKNNSFAEKITIQGYCLGATMAAIYTSLYQRNIKNLCTTVPIINTEKDQSVLGSLAKKLDVDELICNMDNFPASYLHTCYSYLKPFKQGIEKYYNLYKNIENQLYVENFLRIEKWLYDTPPIAGETFRQWIKDIYQENLLFKNKMKINGKIIDLKKIEVPTLNVVAEEDHLVSPLCSMDLASAISSKDKMTMKFFTGHVGLIASNYSQNNVLPKVGEWIKTRSL